MNGALRAVGLLAGIAGFDILMNLPCFSRVSPVATLLAPSVDLLVVLALLMTVTLVTQHASWGFAVAVALLVAFYVGWQAYRRWGVPPAVGQITLLGSGVVGVGVASFFLSKLVLRGFSNATLRSLVLLAAACCALIQALLGVRVFSSSMVPGMLGFR